MQLLLMPRLMLNSENAKLVVPYIRHIQIISHYIMMMKRINMIMKRINMMMEIINRRNVIRRNVIEIVRMEMEMEILLVISVKRRNMDKTPEIKKEIVIKRILIYQYRHQLGKISTAMLYIKNSNQAWLSISIAIVDLLSISFYNNHNNHEYAAKKKGNENAIYS